MYICAYAPDRVLERGIQSNNLSENYGTLCFLRCVSAPNVTESPPIVPPEKDACPPRSGQVHCIPAELFSDAEGRENAIEDVVRGGLAGDGVEGMERAVEIEQQHFVRDVFVDGYSGGSKRTGAFGE